MELSKERGVDRFVMHFKCAEQSGRMSWSLFCRARGCSSKCAYSTPGSPEAREVHVMKLIEEFGLNRVAMHMKCAEQSARTSWSLFCSSLIHARRVQQIVRL